MVEVPPDEAFQPDPAETPGGGRLRRRLRVAVTLIVVASMIVLAAVERTGVLIRDDPIEQPTRSPSRLVAVDSAGALTTFDELGTSQVTYPVAGVAFQFPAWSPEGTHFAAIGQGPDGAGVFVFTARAVDDPATDPVVVYQSADRPPFYLYWTPDGRRVTFLTTEPDGLALRIAPADGSATSTTVRAGAPMYWDFVDSGRLLVHSGANGPNGFFAEVGADGAPFEGLSAAPGLYRAPATSGNDRLRAYATNSGGATSEIVVDARDGSGATRVRVFGPAAFAFNPQGDELAFVAADASGTVLPLPVGPLRILDQATRDARTLLGGRVVAFFWSPTGKAIAVLRLDDADDNVTEAHRSTGTTLARAGSSADEAAAGLAMRLTFVGTVTGTVGPERLVRLSDLFVNQVLPYFDQYALSHRFWSPDGAAIVLPIVGEGDVTRLFAIPVDGSDARALATAEMGFWSP